MGKLKQREKDKREERIHRAIKAYKAGEGSMRAVAERFEVGYGTLQGRVNGGAGPRSKAYPDVQLLDDEQEKSIVRFCLKVDEWGHPLRLSYVKAMAKGMLPKEKKEYIGKHWLTRFLNRRTEIVSKFATRLDRQRVFANNPKIIKDYFNKVCSGS
jgi:transposase